MLSISYVILQYETFSTQTLSFNAQFNDWQPHEHFFSQIWEIIFIRETTRLSISSPVFFRFLSSFLFLCFLGNLSQSGITIHGLNFCSVSSVPASSCLRGERSFVALWPDCAWHPKLGLLLSFYFSLSVVSQRGDHFFQGCYAFRKFGN